MLAELAAKLRQSMGILHKQDIQITARGLGEQWNEAILLGDDCAAIRDRDGYLLLAAEGMLPQLIETDPWFAGWCSVMAARVVTVVRRSCRLRRPGRVAMVAVPGCCRCGVPAAPVVPAVRVRPEWPEARRRIR